MVGWTVTNVDIFRHDRNLLPCSSGHRVSRSVHACVADSIRVSDCIVNALKRGFEDDKFLQPEFVFRERGCNERSSL